MGLGLRVSRAYFDGLQTLKGKTAVLQGSITCLSGLQGLYLLKFEKTTVGSVCAPGLQAFKMMGSMAPVTTYWGPLKNGRFSNGDSRSYHPKMEFAFPRFKINYKVV